MKDTQLYEQLLGLKHPWSVHSVDVDLQHSRVTVHVVCARDMIWGDPETNQDRAHVHGWIKRQWRHLDTCQLQTYIEAEVPRLKFKSGRVEDAAVPWAERYSRVTVLFEAFVIRLLQASAKVQRVATLVRLDWHTVNEVVNRAVKRGMARRTEQGIRYVGIDEKSFGRGQDYCSVLTDIQGKRVLDLVPGRTRQAADELLGTLTPKQRESVTAVVMDMWQAYMGAAQAAMPQAQIVHDKFHVSRDLNDAVDEVRRAEHKRLGGARGHSTLTGTKHMWYRHMPDRASGLEPEFWRVYATVQHTSRAWTLKESFAGFWECVDRDSALAYFKGWAARTMRSNLEPMKEVAATLRRHLEGLLGYSIHRVTNAAAEGFNSIIQSLKAAARGFRNFENFRARVLFFCGALDLAPANAGSH
jgi:transposase